jgi:hypothetical protein
VNSKEENSSDFCLDFVQEFGLRAADLYLSQEDKNPAEEEQFCNVM